MPVSLVNLLLDQLRGLSKSAMRLVRLASTEGPSTPAAVLEPALSALGEDLGQAVEEVRGSGILRLEERESGTFYAFRHPLMQQVVYADVIPAERSQMHRLMAQVTAMRAQQSPIDAATVGAIARHWWAAGDPGQAFPWLLAAARAAGSVFAFSEADALWRRVLEAYPYAAQQRANEPKQIGYRPAAEHDVDGKQSRSELHAQGAQAASLAGDSERALALVEVALEDNPSDSVLLAR